MLSIRRLWPYGIDYHQGLFYKSIHLSATSKSLQFMVPSGICHPCMADASCNPATQFCNSAPHVGGKSNFIFWASSFILEQRVLFCLTGSRRHPSTHPSLAEVCCKRIAHTKYQLSSSIYNKLWKSSEVSNGFPKQMSLFLERLSMRI